MKLNDTISGNFKIYEVNKRSFFLKFIFLTICYIASFSTFGDMKEANKQNINESKELQVNNSISLELKEYSSSSEFEYLLYYLGLYFLSISFTILNLIQSKKISSSRFDIFKRNFKPVDLLSAEEVTFKKYPVVRNKSLFYSKASSSHPFKILVKKNNKKFITFLNYSKIKLSGTSTGLILFYENEPFIIPKKIAKKIINNLSKKHST